MVGVFSRDLIILLENPPIFGAASQWSGEIAIFRPILLEIATFHPHIGSQGKDFVASGLSGLENQSCLRSRRREKEDKL